MQSGNDRKLYICIPAVFAFIALLYLSSFAQEEWQLIDESVARLSDTVSVSLSVAEGDVNADGTPDLLVGQFPDITGLPGNAQLFINNGDGYFILTDSRRISPKEMMKRLSTYFLILIAMVTLMLLR